MHCVTRRPPLLLDLHRARLKQQNDAEIITDNINNNNNNNNLKHLTEGVVVVVVGPPGSTTTTTNSETSVNGTTEPSEINPPPHHHHNHSPNGNLTPDLQLTTSPPNFPKSGRFFSPCKVGRYVLLDQLDERPMYKCVNIDNNEEFTCKIVNNDGHKTLSAHFRVDTHEHINEIVEVMVGDRHTYLIFPRSYGDLHSYVRTRRRLREPEAQRLFKQVAEAVKHCHQNGIVLRDLKLRRFVFKDYERTQLKLESLEDVVVIDDDDDDTLDDKHGCPAYVSPEILTPNESYSGKAADIWSMGVMLYAMLVGRYPFHDTEPNNLFNKIRSGHYTIPDTVSSKAKCLIRSLLQHNPTERLIAEDVINHPWLKQSSDTKRCYEPRLSPQYDNKSNNKPDQLVPEVNSLDRVSVTKQRIHHHHHHHHHHHQQQHRN